MLHREVQSSAGPELNNEEQSASLAGRRVLFISYNGMLDPLGQTQVIPYLRQLAKRGVRFTLLSFERDQAFEPDGVITCEALRQKLLGDGIEWHWLRYHQKPSLPATAYDVIAGSRYARKLVRRNRIELVHARSHIPATIGLALQRKFDLKLIFDVRGLMAEEYVDANHWRKDSVPYRLTKRVERKALQAAEGVVTLTEAIWPIMKGWPVLRERRDVAHVVVPCCADLELFKYSEEDRRQRRAELGLADRFVVVYSGSIDGWYLTEQMADFFACLLKQRSDAHALWLTPSKHERIRKLMTERDLPGDRYTVLAAEPAVVPAYLSASDAGLAFIKPCFSKLASSPTKYAEYLACGLPLIINPGIGDADKLVTEEGAGVLVNELNDPGYRNAVSAIARFAADKDRTRTLARNVAERLFDVGAVGVERYSRLYETVLDRSDQR
jgi:glycosyltransferase involved in cell wall biosynthesis